jgi:hypothetical protein
LFFYSVAFSFPWSKPKGYLQKKIKIEQGYSKGKETSPSLTLREKKKYKI